MAKKARLEIRMTEEDKELLIKVAAKRNCSVTDLIQDYIQELITESYTKRPPDSDTPLVEKPL